MQSVAHSDEANYSSDKIACIDLALIPADLPFGKVSAVAGEAAYRFIERAVQLVERHEAQAICTAPLSKEALHAAGHPVVVDAGILPIINTGIAHKRAGVGMIGAGLVRPPWACFVRALEAFTARYAA